MQLYFNLRFVRQDAHLIKTDYWQHLMSHHNLFEFRSMFEEAAKDLYRIFFAAEIKIHLMAPHDVDIYICCLFVCSAGCCSTPAVQE